MRPHRLSVSGSPITSLVSSDDVCVPTTVPELISADVIPDAKPADAQIAAVVTPQGRPCVIACRGTDDAGAGVLALLLRSRRANVPAPRSVVEYRGKYVLTGNR